MDIQNILGDLKRERERIDRAISALEGLGGQRRRGRPVGSHNVATSTAKGPRRHMSAAARKRISDMMKQRWAERKKKSKS
jgi:hypothetical protein